MAMGRSWCAKSGAKDMRTLTMAGAEAQALAQSVMVDLLWSCFGVAALGISIPAP